MSPNTSLVHQFSVLAHYGLAALITYSGTIQKDQIPILFSLEISSPIELPAAESTKVSLLKILVHSPFHCTGHLHPEEVWLSPFCNIIIAIWGLTFVNESKFASFNEAL